jgi:hypothetical protein
VLVLEGGRDALEGGCYALEQIDCFDFEVSVVVLVLVLDVVLAHLLLARRVAGCSCR